MPRIVHPQVAWLLLSGSPAGLDQIALFCTNTMVSIWVRLTCSVNHSFHGVDVTARIGLLYGLPDANFNLAGEAAPACLFEKQ